MSGSIHSTAARQLDDEENYRNELLVWERILDVRLADCRKCGGTAPEIAPPSLFTTSSSSTMDSTALMPRGLQPVKSLDELRTLLLDLIHRLRRGSSTAVERRCALNALQSLLARMDRCCAAAAAAAAAATTSTSTHQQVPRRKATTENQNSDDRDTGATRKRKADDTTTGGTMGAVLNNQTDEKSSNKKAQQIHDKDHQSTVIATPGRLDVLAGVRKKASDHPGNVAFHKYVQENLAEWIRCGDDSQKRRVLERRVQSQVEARGGRFLERHGKGWVLLDEARILKKTMDCFRQKASKVQDDNIVEHPVGTPSYQDDDDEEEEDGTEDNHEAVLETLELDPSPDSGNNNNCASNSPIQQPGTYDVLKHGGNTRQVHPGNQTFKKLLRQHATDFVNSSRKREEVEKVIAQVTRLGGRFLERDNSDSYWVERDPVLVKAAVKTALTREAKRLDETANVMSDGVDRASPRLDNESDLLSPKDEAYVNDDSSVRLKTGTPAIAITTSSRNSTSSHGGGDSEAIDMLAVPRKQKSSATTPEKSRAAETKTNLPVSPGKNNALFSPQFSSSETQTPSSSELQSPRTIVPQSKVNVKDVLCPADSSWPGNTFFMEQLQLLRHEYDVETQCLKIASAALDRVYHNGGRFLKPLGNSEWVECSRKEMISDIRSQLRPSPVRAAEAVSSPESSTIWLQKDSTELSKETGCRKETPPVNPSIDNTAKRSVASTFARNDQNGKDLSSDRSSTMKSAAGNSICFRDATAVSFATKKPPLTSEKSDRESEKSWSDRGSTVDRPLDDGPRDFTKESRPYMLRNGRNYWCILCDRVGIQEYHLASHSRKPEHVERLRSAPFFYRSGRHMWECSLCKQTEIHDEELAIHCVKQFHLQALHLRLDTRQDQLSMRQARDSARSEKVGSGDDPAGSTHLNFDNWPPPVRDSTPFLVRDGRRHFRCVLCHCSGIQDISLLSHCIKREHAEKLAHRLRMEPKSHLSNSEELRPQNAAFREEERIDRGRDLCGHSSCDKLASGRTLREEGKIGRGRNLDRHSTCDKFAFGHTFREEEKIDCGRDLHSHSTCDKLASGNRTTPTGDSVITRQPPNEYISASEKRISSEGALNRNAQALENEGRTPPGLGALGGNLSSRHHSRGSNPSFEERVADPHPPFAVCSSNGLIDFKTNRAIPPTPSLLLIDERSVQKWNHFSTLTGKMHELHRMVTLTAPPDQHPTYACTQDERVAVQVTFLPNKMLDVGLARQVYMRLAEWDPFWKTLSIVGMGVTTKIQSASPETGLIRTAAVYNLTLPLRDEHGLAKLKWGHSRESVDRTNGDVALILRMLPVDSRTYQKKRSDCHLWPKGTFLLVNGRKIQLTQRKQQAHDHSEWKYLCRDLDLTEYIRDPKQKNNFQFFCSDDQPYVFVFCFAQYRSVKQLKLYCDEAIPVLHQEAGFEKAIGFISQAMTVTLDSDDEVAQDNDETRKFVYSLMCPISKTIIRTPVRGKNCKHFQCFDLESYISANAFVSGSRWRCASCESFLSLKSLERCGLTSHLLHEFALTVSADRDRVELRADRSYILLKARQPRSKKQLLSENAAASIAVTEEDNPAPPVKKSTVRANQEVIDLCECDQMLLL